MVEAMSERLHVTLALTDQPTSPTQVYALARRQPAFLFWTSRTSVQNQEVTATVLQPGRYWPERIGRTGDHRRPKHLQKSTNSGRARTDRNEPLGFYSAEVADTSQLGPKQLGGDHGPLPRQSSRASVSRPLQPPHEKVSGRSVDRNRDSYHG